MAENKKKTRCTKPTPEQEIRCGAVLSQIFRRQTNNGHNYYEYVLLRVWTAISTGKEQYSSSGFAATNQGDLFDAIRETTAWLTETEKSERDNVSDPPANTPDY